MAFGDDFWLDEIKYPNDANGNPVYGALDARHPDWHRMTNWQDLGPNGEWLRSEETTWVWIHPNNGRVWHLSGPKRGKEGVSLARDLDGVMQADFDTKYSKGPYLIGAEPERTDYDMRIVRIGVWLNATSDANRPSPGGPFALGMIEDIWWNSWDEKVPGYLGCFSRTHGWRWLSLTLGEPAKVDLQVDPKGKGRGAVRADIVAHAPFPFYAKRALSETWKASIDDFDEHGVCTGVITIANQGTWTAMPKFLIRGTGESSVQDGIDGKMVPLPTLFPEDGAYMLVDTDGSRQTIVTEKEPVDDQLFKFMRNSQLMDTLLHDTLQKTLPAQRRIPGGIGFDQKIPPRTVAHLRVTHTNPNASITVIMPQHFKMAWA